MFYLKLLIFKNTTDVSKTGFIMPKCSLSFESDYRIFGQINTVLKSETSDPLLKTENIPAGCNIYIDSEITNVDDYGTRLTMISLKELKKIKIPEDSDEWNIQIKNILNTLPNSLSAILYWS